MTIKVDFLAKDDTLIGYDYHIIQDDKDHVWHHDDVDGYLGSLSKYLKQGMVLQISQVVGDPNAIDSHQTCEGGCGDSDKFKMGNLVVESPDQVYPPSEPALDKYEWEEAPWETHMCPDLDTDECKYSWRCISCRKSYPVGDEKTWDSPDAKCRCYDWTPYPTPWEEHTYCPFFTDFGAEYLQ